MIVAATLVATIAASVQVQGPSRCPTPSEVAAVLTDLLPATEPALPDVAWIEAADDSLQIDLRSTDGDELASRRLTSAGTCGDRATIAAVVIASWIAERNPDLSLRQAGPRAPVAPAPLPAPVTKTDAPAAPPGPENTREFDLSLALGTSASRAGFVGAARLETSLRGRHFGLHAGFAAETAHDESILVGHVSWRRFGPWLGPLYTITRRPITVDARAGFILGFTSIAGHGFDVDRQARALAPGLALASRLSATRGWIRPWIEIGGQLWLSPQEITITRQTGPDQSAALPRTEGRLFGGLTIVLSR